MKSMKSIKKIIKTLFFPKKKKIINSNRIIVFGEWFGEKCCDNCLYFANYLASNDSSFELYWVSKKECDCSRLDSKIIRIEYDGQKAKEIISKAKFIIVNQGIVDITSDAFFYPENSILINFWHGVAWKKIGSDSVKNKLKALYTRRAYKKDGTDYYL